MNGFTDDWLALREPADHQARSAGLVDKFRRSHRAGKALKILDLGAGSGANFRFMAPRLGAGQHWRLLDHDAGLLAGMPGRLAVWAQNNEAQVFTDGPGWHVRGKHFDARINTEIVDLSEDFASIDFDAIDLVTGSALLDLVSVNWLSLLAQACAGQACAALFALSYDGRAHWSPVHPLDARVLEAFNMHQRQDKTFGRALGPDAIAVFGEQFAARDYRIESESSAWVLGAAQHSLQLELMQGWAEAASEAVPSLNAGLPQWLASRQACAAEESTTMTVGHADLLAMVSPD